MPKKKAKKPKKPEPDASYDGFRAQWERAKPRRQRQRGRGKPGDMDYRPPVIGPPRPHRTKAADFLDELLWLGAYVGGECFLQAYYVAGHESGVIKDGTWNKDFRVSAPLGYTPDPFRGCVSDVARLIFAGWHERVALAWAVAKFDLPGLSFYAAVARMRKALRAAEKAGVFPV
jgi:hypothetical protein